MSNYGSIAPFEGKKNKYIDLMKKAYELAEYKMVPIEKSHLFFSPPVFYSFNWVENAVIQKTKLHSYTKFVYMYLYIFWLSYRTNIIWTMHNKVPHDSSNNKLVNSLIKLLLKKSKLIWIHSSESLNVLEREYMYQSSQLNSKIRLLPHPNYIDCYGQVLPAQVSSDKLKLLFVGAIRPYKNIELLIKSIKDLQLPNLELTICGSATDTYKEELMSSLDGLDSIKTDFRFIDDNELPELLSRHHLLVTPYSKDDSLNSGSHYLAFSYKRTVLSTNISSLKDMYEIKNSFFSYDYNTNEQHQIELKRTILKVYNDYSADYNQLLLLGEQCFDYVRTNNDLSLVANCIKKEISKLH